AVADAEALALRLGGLQRRHPGLLLLAARAVLGLQPLRLGRGQPGPALGHLRPQLRRLQPHQQLPRLDDVALLDVDRGDPAADLRPQPDLPDLHHARQAQGYLLAAEGPAEGHKQPPPPPPPHPPHARHAELLPAHALVSFPADREFPPRPEYIPCIYRGRLVPGSQGAWGAFRATFSLSRPSRRDTLNIFTRPSTTLATAPWWKGCVAREAFEQLLLSGRLARGLAAALLRRWRR